MYVFFESVDYNEKGVEIVSESRRGYEDFQSQYVSVNKAKSLITSSTPECMLSNNGVKQQRVSLQTCNDIIFVKDSYDIFFVKDNTLCSHGLSYADKDMESYCRKKYGRYHNYYENRDGKNFAIEARRLDDIKQITEDICFVLKWHEDQDNYWHFMYECLPRLYAFKMGMQNQDIRNIKLVVVGAPLKEYQVALIRGVLGFEPESLACTGPIMIRNCILVNISNAAYTREDFLEGMTSTIKRNLGLNEIGQERDLDLYIVRGRAKNKRNIVNDEEVKELLISKGYTIFDAGRHDVKKQIEVFSRARTLVGGHGAALANVGFSKEPAIIEIHGRGYYSCTTFLINSLKRGRYIAIGSEMADACCGDYRVELGKMERALALMKME